MLCWIKAVNDSMIQGDYYDNQTKLPLQGTNTDIEQLSDAAGREKKNGFYEQFNGKLGSVLKSQC